MKINESRRDGLAGRVDTLFNATLNVIGGEIGIANKNNPVADHYDVGGHCIVTKPVENGAVFNQQIDRWVFSQNRWWCLLASGQKQDNHCY
jgi:hypothetical protein